MPFQASARFASANIPLAKASHLAKLKVKVGQVTLTKVGEVKNLGQFVINLPQLTLSKYLKKELESA